MIDTRRQLESLIIQYSPMLHAMVKKHITADYHDGWDAYQDICLELLQYVPVGFDPDRGTNLFVYFRRSAFNAVKHYRKRRRRGQLSPPIYREHFTDRLMGIVRAQDSKLVDFLMHRASTTLHKKILEMCLDSYTPVEMMRVLKISRSTVYKYLRFFRRLIQEYMKDVHF